MPSCSASCSSRWGTHARLAGVRPKAQAQYPALTNSACPMAMSRHEPSSAQGSVSKVLHMGFVLENCAQSPLPASSIIGCYLYQRRQY